MTDWHKALPIYIRDVEIEKLSRNKGKLLLTRFGVSKLCVYINFDTMCLQVSVIVLVSTLVHCIAEQRAKS